MTGTPLIRFNHVMRDAVQSLVGTNPSADEMLEAYSNTHKIGTDTIQTGGGTFFDIFAKKGRNEWDEVEKIFSHFKERDIKQTVLIRGDCLFGYRPQAFDVIQETVREYAKMGVNVFQNFHGMNDVRALESVAKAVQTVKAEGYDVRAQGVICVEDNPNVTIESCLETARQLIATGHEGFYLKSASGYLSPEFVGELTGKLIDEFPAQSVDVHVHTTYGVAAACYMAAIDAATSRGHSVGIDVQHPSMSGSTSQPSMTKMLELIQHHPKPAIRENAPILNTAAIIADAKPLSDLRFRYRNFEASYNPELLQAMNAARAPGGATSTLKSIPNLVDNISILMEKNTGKKPTWDDIQIAIYEMQSRILGKLGEPTQVTPYALNTTMQASACLMQELQGKDPFRSLTGETRDYLAGYYGRVPASVDPELQKQALQLVGLEAPVEYVPAHLKPQNALPAAIEKLKAAGLEEPTTRQAISAVTLKDGLTHVLNCANGTNTPAKPPALPDYAVKQPEFNGNRIRQQSSKDAVDALGGISYLEHISQCAVFLRQLGDNLNPFPPGVEHVRGEWVADLRFKLHEFITTIPDKLGEAGFRGFTDLHFSPMARGFRLHEVDTFLRDIVDHRSPGLFDHMMAEIKAAPVFAKTPKNDGNDPDGPTGQVA